MVLLSKQCQLIERPNYKKVNLTSGKTLFIDTGDFRDKGFIPSVETLGVSVKIDLEFLDKLLDYSNFPKSNFTLVGKEDSLTLSQQDCIELLEAIKEVL